MLSTSHQLLIRPRHSRNESLRGYVSRVSNCNGSSPLLKPALVSLRATTSALDEIATLTGTHVSILEAHCSLKRVNHGNYSEVVFGDALIPINLVWLNRRMLCPACFSEAGISHCLWELSKYDVCHLHGCYLVSRCHVCSRSLQWTCGSKYRCICGIHFGEIETTAAPVSRKARSRLLASAATRTLYRPIPTVKTPGLIAPLIWFFLFENFIRSVLIPGFCEEHNPTVDEASLDTESLVVTILQDEEYCRYLRQTIFLHAASDPMTMTQTLRADQSPVDMKKHFWHCLDGVIFHDALYSLPRMRGLKRFPRIHSSRENPRASHAAQLRRAQDYFPSDFATREEG